jgi:two-component system OmpR family response regulator
MSHSLGRILIVDDEEAIRSVLIEQLERTGYDTIAFVDAAPVREADLDDIDLIVTDLAMPTSGEKLIEDVRGRGFKGPIIIITGFLDDKDTEHLMAIGADRVLQKPIRMAVLLSTVELLLSPGVEEETSQP